MCSIKRWVGVMKPLVYSLQHFLYALYDFVHFIDQTNLRKKSHCIEEAYVPYFHTIYGFWFTCHSDFLLFVVVFVYSIVWFLFYVEFVLIFRCCCLFSRQRDTRKKRLKKKTFKTQNKTSSMTFGFGFFAGKVTLN